MKKLLAATLSVLMVSSALTGCSGGKTETQTANETSAAASNAESVAETEEQTTTRSHNVPAELDFGGETFTTSYGLWQGYCYYFFADEENGDVMNDSIYQRKRKVEEELNVSLVNKQNKKCEGVVADVKTSVLAGDDTYQMAMMHCILSIAEFASGGYIYNWDDLPYTDYTADWWNQEMMDTLRLGKNTYYGISDFMIPCPYVVFFNKELVANLSMDNPYQLVYDGSWTIDRFCDMAIASVSDIDGDGQFTINDRYGISCNEGSKYTPFITAAGQFITQKNAEGRVELAMNTEKTVSIVDKFASMTGENVYYMPKSDADADQLSMDSGRVMFWLDAISEAIKMRDYEVDFGFLPYPKYDEAQKDYLSLDWGGLCCIPSTIQNPEMVGAVVELLAYYSGETVIPTYYDVMLAGKLARDDDTVKMMDILFDTVCYEVGGNYFGFSGGFSELFYTMSNLAILGKSDFGSYYTKNEKSAIKIIDDFYTDLEANEG